MPTASGRCLCGAVSFTAEEVDTGHQACHCSMCRRWASGPVLSTAGRGVTFNGTDNIATFASSQWGERGFCKNCGSHIYFYVKPLDQYFLSIGAFDGPSQFHLAREIYIDSKPEGYAFSGNNERLTEADIVGQS